MGYSKLSVVLCLTVCLSVLFAPFIIEISPDGKTYAGSSKSNNKGAKGKVADFHGYTTPPENNDPGNNPSAPAPVPEPATMLLFGGGAIGLAALKRKFKKK